MAFDKLYYFEKTPTLVTQDGLKSKRYYFGEIQNNFNMSFVGDGTKDSAKVIVFNFDSKELDPLTICWLESTNTWWVVKGDKVTRYANELGGYYQHDISIYGALEILNARDLTNCGFNANRYTLAQFLGRLTRRMDFELPITWVFGTYADLNQTVTYLKTFQNYTPMSAIRELYDGMNLYPKMTFTTDTLGEDVYLKGATITAYSKSGSINEPISIDTFNNEEEQCSSDIESFGTRVISNVQNCVSADPIRYPAIGGTRLTSSEPTVSASNGFIRLPSNIYQVNKIIIGRLLAVEIGNYGVGTTTKAVVVNPLNYNKTNFLSFLKSTFTDISQSDWESFETVYDAFYAEYSLMGMYELENGGLYNRVDSTWTQPYLQIVAEATGEHGTQFEITLNDKTHGTTAIYNQKWSMYWEQGKDIIESFGWLGDTATNFPNSPSPTSNSQIYNFGSNNFIHATYTPTNANPDIGLGIISKYFTISNTRIAVEYVPMSDLKVKVDNNKEQNDSNLYNQNGKLVDSVAISKLINAHAKEISSNEITRYKTYRNFSDIPQVSQVVDNDGERYVINNVSIDFSENDDRYFMVCQFTMTKQTACKSTMISANTNIRDYDCPQQNNVPRIQIYRDYIEFGYNAEHAETPYLALSQTLRFDATSKGLVDNHTCVFSATDSANNTYYYQIGTTKYNLNKQFIEVADFKDNNIIGYEAGKSYVVVQASTLLDRKTSNVNTPISYVDSLGELKSLDLYFADADQLEIAYEKNNATEIIGKFVTVPTEIWNYITYDSSRYDINISEPNYEKDGLEVPVFEYACQVGDNNGIVFGADFLKGENAVQIDYKYKIVDGVYVTQENASTFFNGSNGTISYSNGEISIGLTGNSIDYKDKSIVVYCDIYEQVGGTHTYNGTFNNASGVSVNDGTQSAQLPAQGLIGSLFLHGQAEAYQLDNPYNYTLTNVSASGSDTIYFYVQASPSDPEVYTGNMDITLSYQVKQTEIVRNTQTVIIDSQNMGGSVTPLTSTIDIGETNANYTDTTTRIITTTNTKNYNVSGIASSFLNGYWRTAVLTKNVPELNNQNASVTIDSPHIITEIVGTTVSYRLLSEERGFVEGTITCTYQTTQTVTFYKRVKASLVSDYVSSPTISQNNIYETYGVSLSNSISVSQVGTLDQITVTVWSDTPSITYSASYQGLTGWSYSFDVVAEHQNVVSGTLHLVGGDSRNTVEQYFSNYQVRFRGTFYDSDISNARVVGSFAYDYTTTTETITSHTKDVVVSGIGPHFEQVINSLTDGVLYGTPTATFKNALVSPFASIDSWDQDTGAFTYTCGDSDNPNAKVGFRFNYVEYYVGARLKQEFLFAVNNCKVSGTNSLTLKVNNWKLK